MLWQGKTWLWISDDSICSDIRKWYFRQRTEEKEIRRIQRLERRVIKLEQENIALKESHAKTASLLERALKFVKEVKKSPAGQIFFGRKLKAIDIANALVDNNFDVTVIAEDGTKKTYKINIIRDGEGKGQQEYEQEKEENK